MIQQYVDNTSPSLTDTITVDDEAFDLDGCTVKFQMRAANSSTLKVNADADIVVEADGTVRYDWDPDDVNTEGDYVGWWRVTLASTATQDSPEFDIKIIGHTSAASNLCTLFDVRQAMEMPDAYVTKDSTIRNYIVEASAQIIKEYQREFAPYTEDDTRRFTVNSSGRVNFTPFVLNNLTAATLHPDDQALELDIDIDVELRPFGAPDGVYTSMKISPFRSLVSKHSIRFGSPYIDLTGDWGYLTVPVPVKRACVIAVRSWLRRDAAAFANSVQGMTNDPGQVIPGLEGTYALPSASRKLLETFLANLPAV